MLPQHFQTDAQEIALQLFARKVSQESEKLQAKLHHSQKGPSPFVAGLTEAFLKLGKSSKVQSGRAPNNNKTGLNNTADLPLYKDCLLKTHLILITR
jgi:hypothetical protein